MKFFQFSVVLCLTAACIAQQQSYSQYDKGVLWKYLFNAEPIPEVIKQLGLSKLAGALQKTGLDKALEKPGTFTVFAPTDTAFDNIPNGLKQFLMNNVPFLTKVLKFHVLATEVLSTDLKNDLQATTLNGKKVRVNIYKDGKVITVDGGKVTKADQKATNGVIHVIDKVLLPPGGPLVKIISGCPKIKTLVTALKAANLVDTLNGPGPFTLFVPMDSAFAKLPPGTLDKLIANKTALTNVLTYHVIKGTFYSAGLSSSSVETLNGMSVKVQVSADGVMVNNARVILPDVAATNGVAHAIDTVLIPSGLTFQNMMDNPRKYNLVQSFSQK